MRLKLIKLKKYSNDLHERLEACLDEGPIPENVIPYIFGEFTVYELEKVTEILLASLHARD